MTLHSITTSKKRCQKFICVLRNSCVKKILNTSSLKSKNDLSILLKDKINNAWIYFSWKEPDDLCNVKVELEEIPMEMYHYSRFIPEDGSCVQGFLTRINDEELPSYILPGMFLPHILSFKI